jgi:hypothetical protein
VSRYLRGPTGDSRISRYPAGRVWIKRDRVLRPPRSICEHVQSVQRGCIEGRRWEVGWRDFVRCFEDISQQRCSPEAKHLTVTLIFVFYSFGFSGWMRFYQCCCLFSKIRGPLSFLDSVCCLLVLDSVTSTPQWIRQPKPRNVVHDMRVCVCV